MEELFEKIMDSRIGRFFFILLTIVTGTVIMGFVLQFIMTLIFEYGNWVLIVFGVLLLMIYAFFASKRKW